MEIAEIKQALPLAQVLQHYRLKPDKHLRLHCPFHDRFGFNGKEHDWEVKGWQNQVDYGFRIHDSRIGRFLSVDPLTKGYPMLTPYQYASNSPIAMIDMDGLEGSMGISGSANVTQLKVSRQEFDHNGD